MKHLDRIVVWVGNIGILATMLIISFNVCSRKLGWPVPGVFSIVSIGAVFLAVPAIIHAHFDRAHIVIDALRSKFSPATLEILETIVGIFTIGIWGYGGWVGLEYAARMWVANEVVEPLNFPVAPFRFVWAIGLMLLCLVMLNDLFLKLRRKGKL
jgi:TRAP-type C4-dicarboxylate transport system permease small subunit